MINTHYLHVAIATLAVTCNEQFINTDLILDPGSQL